ncbi:MAG: hypothetical protein ACP5TO_05755 [Thermoplasmata archaeon]
MNEIQYLLREDWEYLMSDYIRSYIDFSETESLDFYEGIELMFPVNTQYLNVFIVIDASNDYEIRFVNEFLDIVYGILKSCKTFPGMRGNLIAIEKNMLRAYDLFEYPSIENLGNESSIKFNDVLSWINTRYADINMMVYYTGKPNGLNIDENFPIIWALTNNKVDVPFGKKVVIFNTPWVDVADLSNHMQRFRH